MCKFIYSFLILLFLSVKLYSFEMELVKVIANGCDNGELLWGFDYADPDNTKGPNGILFLKTGQLVIADTWNERLAFFDEEFNFVKNIMVTQGTKNLLSFHFSKVDSGFLSSYMFDRYALVSNSGEPIFYYTFQFHPLSEDINSRSDQVVYNGYFFKKTNDNRIFCIIPSQEFNNEDMSNILWDEDVYAMFDEDSEYDLEGLTIDENGIFYLNGELYTQNYRTYIQYWMLKYSYTDIQDFRNDQRHSIKPLHMDLTGIRYCGVDSKGNTYWKVGTKWIQICDKNGIVLERIEYDRSRSSVIPTVSPDGDIYFLKSSPEDHKLYRIRRTW